jgi:hypothetical protein
LAASRNWPPRFHQRSRGIDASSSTKTPATVTMPRTSSFVRMMDSSTTVPANKDAHRYMSRTLPRCECPMASSRCCRCFLSAENGDCPARVRRTTASSRSAYGISMMMAGTSSGRISGKRLTVPPL